MRLFVGLELDEPVRVAAAAAAARLESRIAGLAGDFTARWIPGSNLHITIWFFGEVSDEAAAILVEQLRAPLRVPAFELRRPRLRRLSAIAVPPRVLWIGTAEGTPSMVAAHAALIDRLAPLDYMPEARAYSPHVTMARVKEPGRRRAARSARRLPTNRPTAGAPSSAR